MPWTRDEMAAIAATELNDGDYAGKGAAPRWPRFPQACSRRAARPEPTTLGPASGPASLFARGDAISSAAVSGQYILCIWIHRTGSVNDERNHGAAAL